MWEGKEAAAGGMNSSPTKSVTLFQAPFSQPVLRLRLQTQPRPDRFSEHSTPTSLTTLLRK